MKQITFFAVLAAVIGFYAFPVLLAQADSATTASGVVIPKVETSTVLYLHITAYSSDEDQTDDTPFLTANGTYVHDGIVATNLLPFGTKIEIPALFGNKVFTVADRMNARMVGRMDVWMPSRGKALIFGSNYANVVVLKGETTTLASAQ